jgi:hypothetical protein
MYILGRKTHLQLDRVVAAHDGLLPVVCAAGCFGPARPIAVVHDLCGLSAQVVAGRVLVEREVPWCPGPQRQPAVHARVGHAELLCACRGAGPRPVVAVSLEVSLHQQKSAGMVSQISTQTILKSLPVRCVCVQVWAMERGSHHLLDVEAFGGGGGMASPEERVVVRSQRHGGQCAQIPGCRLDVMREGAGVGAVAVRECVVECLRL